MSCETGSCNSTLVDEKMLEAVVTGSFKACMAESLVSFPFLPSLEKYLGKEEQVSLRGQRFLVPLYIEFLDHVSSVRYRDGL